MLRFKDKRTRRLLYKKFAAYGGWLTATIGGVALIMGNIETIYLRLFPVIDAQIDIKSATVVNHNIIPVLSINSNISDYKLKSFFVVKLIAEKKGSISSGNCHAELVLSNTDRLIGSVKSEKDDGPFWSSMRDKKFLRTAFDVEFSVESADVIDGSKISLICGITSSEIQQITLPKNYLTKNITNTAKFSEDFGSINSAALSAIRAALKEWREAYDEGPLGYKSVLMVDTSEDIGLQRG